MLLLTLLNGILSGAEAAMLRLRLTRVEELADEGSTRATVLLGLLRDPERFMATVQVGITLVGVTGAAFSGSTIADRLVPVLERVPALVPYAENVAFFVVVVGVSTLSIVLGELVPKSLALRSAETVALLAAPVIATLATVGRPLVWVLHGMSNVILRPFGDSTSFTEGRHSRDEIQQIVDQAATAGTVDPRAGEIASRALEFSDLDVATVMVPKPSIVSVDLATPVSKLPEIALQHGHSRILVHDGHDDNVIGFVNLREALARSASEPSMTLRDAMRTVPFVPETMLAPTLLRELQRQRAHMAVVIDEVGTVRGLVTIEDLVEELVGDILSENDRPNPAVRIDADGSAIVDGSMPLHDVVRAIGVELPETEQFSTIAGLLIEMSGTLPTVGQRFDLDEGVTIEVIEATARRVKRVRVRRPQSSDDTEA